MHAMQVPSFCRSQAPDAWCVLWARWERGVKPCDQTRRNASRDRASGLVSQSPIGIGPLVGWGASSKLQSQAMKKLAVGKLMRERLKAASNGGPNRARSAIFSSGRDAGDAGLGQGPGEEEEGKKIPAWSLHSLRAGPFRVSPGPAGLTAAGVEGKTPRQTTRQPHLQLNPHFLSTPRRKKGRVASIAIRSDCKASS